MDRNYQATPKTKEVLHLLKNNQHGCDMLLCLFMAALRSYKADKCLRPFPPMYLNHSHKEIDRLRNTCSNIPPLNNLIKNTHSYSEEIYDLLAWLFCSVGHPHLRLVNYESLDVPSKRKSLQPQYVFEVVYPTRNEDMWLKRKGNNRSFLAYHGSAIHNFYSILRVGLQHNISENKLLFYGEGIYLSTEITVSLPYAPYGVSWAHSELGNKHSVIAICEVIDDVDKVKCKGRNIDGNQLSGDIADKYFVATDSETVRVKYLLVYKESNSLKSWTYKLIIVLISLYLLILCCNRLFQPSTWNKLQKRFYNLV